MHAAGYVGATKTEVFAVLYHLASFTLVSAIAVELVRPS
jgi:hypothetical protein